MDLQTISHLLSAATQAVTPEMVEGAGQAAQAAAKEGSGGVLDTFGVNWKMFVAQLINFSLVLFVLWKYAFGPVSRKLQERSEKIGLALKDAERIEQEKQEFDQWKQEEMERAKKQAAELISQAEVEASKLKAGMVEQTRQEQEKVIAEGKTLIEEDRKKAIAQAKSEMADMITQAAEKILRKKLDDKSDKELIEKTIKEI